MKKIGLIGGRVEHSYSPMIHSKFGDYQYDLLQTAPEELEARLRDTEYSGFNVTIPYKIDVMQYCDEVSDEATKIGSVNTIVRDENGKLKGYNTDYFGFRYMMEDAEISVTGRKCVVLGSGGASRTVQAVLKDLDAEEIIVVSRTGENNYDNLEKHHDAEIVINTTPVGMYPDNLHPLVNIEEFFNCKGVMDLIFNPHRTKLILDAQRLGIPAAGGMDMIVAQAWEASELFQGIELDRDLIPIVIDEVKREKMNTVLIGMPGSGKTFLGKTMAQSRGKEFVDIDDIIEEREGMSIPEIFDQKGEGYFRKVETAILEETCKKTGLVIATGGGVVKKRGNRDIIRQNSVVIWVKRDLDKLAKDGRPLSLSTPLEQLYEERKDAYDSWSDYFINNNQEMK